MKILLLLAVSISLLRNILRKMRSLEDKESRRKMKRLRKKKRYGH
jgi:hypothetical protein